MTSPISAEKKLPFYTSIEEDHIAQVLQQEGMADPDGIITVKGQEELDKYQYELDLEAIDNIQKLFNENFVVVGRCPFLPLNIPISMREIALSIQSLTGFDNPAKFILNGGSLCIAVNRTILRILETWVSDPSTTSSNLISLAKEIHESTSTFFRKRTSGLANDIDWKIQIDGISPESCKSLIEKSIVVILANKLKEKLISPAVLTLKLAKLELYNRENNNSYLTSIFKKYGPPTVTHPNLYNFFIEAFAFQVATDVDDENSCFSLRSLGGPDRIHDFFFPARRTPTPTCTPIKALFTDVTELTNSETEPKLYLQSYIGKPGVNVMQALVDNWTTNYTFEDTAIPNKLDFARTITHFSQGGHCYKKKWPEKILSSLLEECAKLQLPLSTLLSRQLISSAINHPCGDIGEFNTLIVLTFNASALLFWMNNQYLKEIQELWKLTFAYIDKKDRNFHLSKVNSLIEQMKNLMRDPLFSFQDLYSQIQVTSAMMQHTNGNHNHEYQCKPSQTCGELFSQIRLSVANNNKNKQQQRDICTLYFPYNLYKSVQHLNKIARANPSTLHYLRHIHNLLIPQTNQSYSLGESSHHEYSNDPRLHLNECANAALKLLNAHDEQTWKLGFLLCLSMLAQRKEETFLKAVVRKFVPMILDNWGSEEFKAAMYNALRGSVTLFSSTTTFIFNEKETIQQLFTAKEESCVDIAWEYFEKIYDAENYDNICSFYLNLLNNHHISRKTQLQLIERMIYSRKFTPETTLKWITDLYQRNDIVNVPELEEALFSALTTTLQRLKKIPKDTANLQQLLLRVLKSESRLQRPLHSLRLAWEIHRLKIITENDGNAHQSLLDTFANLQSSLGEHNDLNLSAYTKDFNTSNPFTNYCIKNLPLLKSSIKTFLQSLSQNFHSKNDWDILFHYIEQLIQSEWGWVERHYILETLKNVAYHAQNKEDKQFVSRHVQGLLKQFHSQQASKFSPQEVLAFYLDIDEPLIVTMLTKTVMNLLAVPANEFSTEALQNGTKFLIDSISQNFEPQMIQQNSFQSYLNRISSKGMWEQIIEIYAAIPEDYRKFSSESSETLIQACSKLLIYREQTLTLNINDQIDNIEQMIQGIPKTVSLQSDVKVELKSLYEFFYTRSLAHRDLFKCLQWLNMQEILGILNHAYYERAFDLITQLIDNKHLREAQALIEKLKSPKGFELSWINIYKLLLKDGHVSTCLHILDDKKSTVFSTKQEIENLWIELLEPMIQQTVKLSDDIENTNEKQLHDLFKMTNKIIFQCQSIKKKLWLTHIEKVSYFAPLPVVVEMLQKLTGKKKYSLPLDDQDKLNCWKMILNRLSLEGSRIFFKSTEWWPQIFADFKTESLGEQLKLIFKLIDGTAKAIEDYIPEQSKALSTGKPVRPPEVVNGAKNVISIIESKEVLSFRDAIVWDTKGLNLAKVYASTGVFKDKISAMTILVSAYAFAQMDPLPEHRIIQLANECLSEMKSYRDDKGSGLSLLKFVQGSQFYNDSNHFVAANYIKSIYPMNIEIDLIQQQKRFKAEYGFYSPRAVFSGLNIYLQIIMNALKGILGNPWQKEQKIGKDEIAIIQWSLERLRLADKYEIYFTGPILEWCLKQDNFKLYASNVTITTLQNYMKIDDWSYPNLFRGIVQYTMDTKNMIEYMKQRQQHMQSYGFGYRFKPMHEERNLYRCFQAIQLSKYAFIVVIVLGISMKIYNAIYDSSK